MTNKVKELVFNTLIESLPEDAENLSTLTPDQALQLLKTFMSKIEKL